jgi:23S rRNA pseudouridine1911/1915/1917 synthase
LQRELFNKTSFKYCACISEQNVLHYGEKEVNALRFLVEEKDNDKLLRDYLREQGVSATLLSRLKRIENGITLNQNQVTVRAILKTGDLLDIAVEEKESPLHIVPRALPVSIVFENDDLLVANKPAFMPTHPSHGHFEDTLANGLSYHYTANGVSFRPRFVNRLDRNTTGAVLVARHALAAATLSADMASGNIKKTYLSLVKGRLDQPMIIEKNIKRRAESIIFREVCSPQEGDYAKTVVLPLAASDDFSLVRLLPETGRTHQLRVHLASIGHPMLGDDLYGTEDAVLKRHALHAATLTFLTPRTRETVKVCAPLPADMRARMTELGEEAVSLAEAECGKTG